MSLACPLAAFAAAQASKVTGCLPQQLALRSPDSILQSCVDMFERPSFASRKARQLRWQHTRSSVHRFTPVKFPCRQVAASCKLFLSSSRPRVLRNCPTTQNKHGAFGSPTQVRAGSQEQPGQSPASRPTTSIDEGVVEDIKSRPSIQGVVRPLVMFLALRTGCEILGLRFVAELLGQPLTSLDPNLKATSILLLAILEYTGTYFLFVAPQGTAQTARGGLRLNSFRPSLVVGKGGWLYPALTGSAVLLAVPTAFFFSAYSDGTEALSLDHFGHILGKLFGTGSIVSASINILLVNLSSPLIEEAVFRGFFQSSLRELNMSSKGATVVSSLVFSVAHLSPRSFLPLLILGLVLGTTYEASGNLCAPFVVHVVYNCVVTLLAAALEAYG